MKNNKPIQYPVLPQDCTLEDVAAAIKIRDLFRPFMNPAAFVNIERLSAVNHYLEIIRSRACIRELERIMEHCDYREELYQELESQHLYASGSLMAYLTFYPWSYCDLAEEYHEIAKAVEARTDDYCEMLSDPLATLAALNNSKADRLDSAAEDFTQHAKELREFNQLNQ